MKIIKYKKMSKGRYKVTFDNSELILYEDVIIKNGLLLNKDITLELLENIIEENKYYEVYNLSLSLIEIKMRTESELKNNLDKKGFEKKLIEEVIERLKKEGYISEKQYIEAYINDKLNLSKDGPYKIKRDLLNLELPENLIDLSLEKISYSTWKDKLEKIINKRVNLMKSKSLYTIKTKLKNELFNLGYDSELIDELLNNINKDESNIIEKEYDKAFIKFSKKHSGIYLENNIKSYLYKKGFNLDDIGRLIDKKKID